MGVQCNRGTAQMTALIAGMPALHNVAATGTGPRQCKLHCLLQLLGVVFGGAQSRMRW